MASTAVFRSLAAAAALFATAIGFRATAAEPTVITLTQTGCQFLESEKGVDHGFETRSKADCEGINSETGDERLAQSRVLTLKPGSYIFRVTNKNVPYDLGFWLRGDGLIAREAAERLRRRSHHRSDAGLCH